MKITPDLSKNVYLTSCVLRDRVNKLLMPTSQSKMFKTLEFLTGDDATAINNILDLVDDSVAIIQEQMQLVDDYITEKETAYKDSK